MRLARLNAGVLASLGMLGASNEAADAATEAALARVDAKLDILLEMFNRYLLGRAALPPRYPVRFNAHGILVPGFPLPEVDTRVLVRLYFDACAGMPMEITGRVAAVDPGAQTDVDDPDTSPGHFVHFDKLAENVHEGIGHLIFRQQRRRLAQAHGGEGQPAR
jgi:hypothetical protein